MHVRKEENALFFLKRKTPAGGGWTAVAADAGGVSVAAASRDPGQTPQLKACGQSPDAAALGALVAEHRLAGTRAVAVLPPEAYSLHLLERPQVPDAELRQAVRWKVKDLLDFPLEEAVVDAFPVPGNPARGRQDMVYVVAARRERVQAEVTRLEAARLRPAVVDIAELAQRNLAALQPEDAGGVAVLHLGPGEGLLTVSREGVLYLARRLELGLGELGGAGGGLEGPLGGTVDGDGPALELEGFDQAQRQAMDTVALEVQRSLDYYESHFGQPPATALVVAPLAQPLPGFVEHLEASLAVRVRQAELSDLVDAPGPLAPAVQARCWFALGAALRHTGS